MRYRTGETVYQSVISVDQDNNPVTGVTFNTKLFRNSAEATGITISNTLSDGVNGVYTFSWTASTTGVYQLWVDNETTNILFMSEVVLVRPDSEFDHIIYVSQ